MYYWFTHNGEKYFSGTEIEVKEKFIQQYDWHSKLTYYGVDYEKQAYRFRNESVCQMTKTFYIKPEELDRIIKRIVTPVTEEMAEANAKVYLDQITKGTPDKYIPGMLSAWIIYIAVYIFSFLLKGGWMLQILATIIFFYCRHEKKFGGKK